MAKKTWIHIPKHHTFSITLVDDKGKIIFHMDYSKEEQRYFVDTYNSKFTIQISKGEEVK